MKLILTLAFILSLGLTPSGAWPAIILFLTFLFSMEILSNISLSIIWKRSLLAFPFVLAAIPLIFIESESSFQLSIAQRLSIPISLSGLERFLSIAFKSWMSVQAAALLSATTPFVDVLLAMRYLRLPSLLVAIVGLMWRYLFVIGSEAQRMQRARTSRSALLNEKKTGISLVKRAKITGGMVASLFLRSFERSERIYTAMLSRGYNGEQAAIRNQSLEPKDLWVLLPFLFLLAGILLIGLVVGG